jgi:hypothetical protein
MPRTYKTRRIISITVVILFMVGAIFIGTGGDEPTDSSGRCVPSGTGEFASATILFIITVIFQIGSYILLEATTISKKQGTEESGIATGQPAEPLENADKKAAVVCGPPPSAPDASSKVNVDPPAPSAPAASTEVNVDSPVHSVPPMSPKASADSTSQV